jgi:outer membrane receptor for ferrienterochelin and colicins
MQKFFSVILFIFLFLNLNAQEKTDVMIFGDVKSIKTKEHIPYANILIKGTKIGTAADKTGHFKLVNIPVGKLTIVAQAIGYKPQEITIVTEKDKAFNLFFELEEDVLELDRVIVTGNRIEESRKESSVIVNLLTSKTFEITNSLNLADGFSFQPGLRLETNCQNCGFQQVRINGLEGPYSQVLIDGRAIFSALNSVYGIEQIPANMIDRVEIIRGGVSAIYSSNAIGGTINILTKMPLNNTFQIAHNSSFTNAKFPDRTTMLNTSLISDDLKTGFVLFGAIRDRIPFDKDGDSFSEIGLLQNQTMGFKTFYRITDLSRINFEYHLLHEFRRGGNKFNLQPHQTDITEQVEHNINSGNISYSFIDNKYNFETYLALQQIKRNSYYGAGQDPNAYGNTKDYSLNAGVQLSYNYDNFIFSPSIFIGGIDYQSNSLIDEMPSYNRTIDQKAEVLGFYLQNEWNINKIKFLLGGRIDKHNLIKNAIISPRTSLLIPISDELQTRLTFSKGFRAPQVFDEDLHVTAVGGEVILIRLADDLKPENTTSISVSLDYYKTLGSVQTNFVIEGFYTMLNDVFVLEEIGVDNQGNKIVERRNGSGAKVYGFNFEGKIAPSSKLNLQFGFTVQRSQFKKPEQWSDGPNVPASQNMFKSPDNYGYLTSSIKLSEELNFSLSAVYTGSMLVPHYAGYIPEDRLEKTKSFFELNLKLAYTLMFNNSLSIQLNTGVQNLLNSYQEDFDKGAFRDAGYIYGPTRPRTIFLGVKISTNNNYLD